MIFVVVSSFFVVLYLEHETVDLD